MTDKSEQRASRVSITALVVVAILLCVSFAHEQNGVDSATIAACIDTQKCLSAGESR